MLVRDDERPPGDIKEPPGKTISIIRDNRCAISLVFGNLRGAAIRGGILYFMGNNLYGRRFGDINAVN